MSNDPPLTRGEKLHRSMLAKYGSEEAILAARKQWGSKGGKKSTGGLAYQTPKRRKEIAKLGHEAFIESIRGRDDGIVRKCADCGSFNIVPETL